MIFPHLDDALEWCEEKVLQSYDLSLLKSQDHIGMGSPIRRLSKAMLSDVDHRVHGLKRDPDYYLKAWKNRQKHASVSASAKTVIPKNISEMSFGIENGECYCSLRGELY